MTDHDVIERVLGMLDPAAGELAGLRRGGRMLLALPHAREAAARTLRLYQPQRLMARGMAALLRGLLRVGMHGHVLGKVRVASAPEDLQPGLSGIDSGTCGVLLGSTEHRVRRAIASDRNAGSWEVAKIAFGEAGTAVLDQEARALEELRSLAAGVPTMLGLHHATGATLLRMPYVTGRPVRPGEHAKALGLLERWITDEPALAITQFPEWPAMVCALSASEAGEQALGHLSRETLRPVICHGDFARWNLVHCDDGRLMALDWEWGHSNGMPGIDLAHYFLQDARLVERLSPPDAIKKTCRLLSSPECRTYLETTGWSGDAMLPIIASLAWKQGAGHQANAEALQASVSVFRTPVFQ